MMKNITVALVFMFAATQAGAEVVNNATKKKLGAANQTVNVVIPEVLPQVAPPPVPLPVVVVETPAPVVAQVNNVASKKAAKNKTEAPPVVFFQQDVRLEDLTCEEPPKGGDNVSAVPVPAALPLMATAFGIFGITRRRKAFK